MSETLYNWLNTEINLSKHISDISSDFANGYFFGELLSKYHLLPTFKEFKNTMIPLDITRNYSLLEKALEDLSIQLTEIQKKEMLSKKKFKAEVFLYKIKQRIANKLISLDTLMAKGVNQVHSIYKEMTTPTKYTKVNIDGNKTRNIQSAKLAPIKFRKLSLNQREQKVIKEIINEEQYLNNQHMEEKKKIHHLESSHHKEQIKKDHLGQTNWDKQMNQKKGFDSKMKEDHFSQTQFYRLATENDFCLSDKTNQLVVNVFDKNLSRLGLDLKIIAPKMIKAQNKIISTEIFMERVRQKLGEQERSRKDKEKRQRKIGSAVIKLNAIRPKTTCMIKANETSSTHFRAGTARFPQKTTNQILPPIETTQADLEYIPLDEFDKDRLFTNLDKEYLQYRLKQTETKLKKRQHDTIIIQPIISAIIDLTEECYQYQFDKKCELIDLNEWKRLIQLFIENKQFHPEEPKKGHNYQMSTDENLHEELSEEDLIQGNNVFSYFSIIPEERKSFTNNDHETFLNYLYMIGEYSNHKIHEQITTLHLDINDVMGNDIGVLIYEQHDYKQSNSLFVNLSKQIETYEPKKEDIEMLQMPTSNTYETFFGDLMKEIIDNALFRLNENNPLQEEEGNDQIIEPPKDNKDFKAVFDSIPLKISFIGNSLSGKKTHAKLIEEKYPGIKVYNFEKIIAELKEKIDKIDTPIESHPKFKTFKKNQIEQINKEKNQIEESIKEYIPLIRHIIEKGRNEEIITNILFESIRRDFFIKNESEVISEIKNRNNRKNIINEEIAKIKEEQIKKPKSKVKEEQQYKLELEKLTNESFKGFIVIDFPNNPEQARILEFKINDYIQAIESGKTKNAREEEELLEICQRVIQPKQLSRKQSAMDKFIILSTTEEEMTRRGENRKIDPQTKIIYHMTDYPPPEKDKKLNERLQLITEPNKKQMEISYKTYLISFDEIMKFYLNFNISKKEISTQQTKEDTHNLIKETLTEMVTKYEEKILSSEEVDKRLRLDSSLINFNLNRLKTQQAKFYDLKMKYPSNLFLSMLNKWKELTINYESHCKDAFNAIKESQKEITQQLAQTEEAFISFLSEKTEKTSIIHLFNSKYRAFCEQYNVLKKNELVVNDFNKDLNELTDRLWEIINEKKNLAIQEHKSIVSDSFVEEKINQVYLSIERLFILETEKLFVIINILSEFFETKESLSFIIKTSHEILKNTSKYSLENNNSCPRLERMFKNCLVLLFRYSLMFKQKEQIVFQKHQIDISQIKKKKMRESKTKSGMTPKQVDNRELDEDIKDSINKYIAIYKYKICSLKFYAEKTLSKIRETVKSLYSAMDEWIILSVKKQNETMNELIDNLRKKIGNSILILDDIELDDFRECFETVDLNITADVDYIDDKVENKVFSLQIVFKANEVLKQYEISYNVITKYLFNEMFIKGFVLNDLHKKCFSKKMQCLNFHHYANLQSHFLFLSNEINPNKLNDKETNEKHTTYPEELLMTNSLLTVILLMHSSKMRDYQGEKLLNDNKDKLYRNNLMKKEDFFSIHFWFEDDNHFNEVLSKLSEDEKKQANYDKLKEIKKCLFEINKINDEEINLGSFIQLCLLNTITLTKKDNTYLQGIEKYEELFHIRYKD